MKTPVHIFRYNFIIIIIIFSKIFLKDSVLGQKSFKISYSRASSAAYFFSLIRRTKLSIQIYKSTPPLTPMNRNFAAKHEYHAFNNGGKVKPKFQPYTIPSHSSLRFLSLFIFYFLIQVTNYWWNLHLIFTHFIYLFSFLRSKNVLTNRTPRQKPIIHLSIDVYIEIDR